MLIKWSHSIINLQIVGNPVAYSCCPHKSFIYAIQWYYRFAEDIGLAKLYHAVWHLALSADPIQIEQRSRLSDTFKSYLKLEVPFLYN